MGSALAAWLDGWTYYLRAHSLNANPFYQIYNVRNFFKTHPSWCV